MRKFVTGALCVSALAVGLVLAAAVPATAGVTGLAVATDPARAQQIAPPAATAVQLASCIRRNTVCRRVNGRRTCRVYRVRVRCRNSGTFHRSKQYIRNKFRNNNKNRRRYRRHRNGGPGVRG